MSDVQDLTTYVNSDNRKLKIGLPRNPRKRRRRRAVGINLNYVNLVIS